MSKKPKGAALGPGKGERWVVLMSAENIDLTFLREIAEARQRIHHDSPTSRPLSDNYEFIGLLGQREFGLRSGLPLDISVSKRGDQGLNFTTAKGMTIHVSTARKPVHLLREADKPAAEVHVLAQVNDNLTGATLIGWEYDRIMLCCPKRTMPGQTILNHAMRADDLRPMADLLELIAEQEEAGRRENEGNDNVC
jgi:hypothetical protein